VLLPAAAYDASAVLTRIERLERRLDIATPSGSSASASPRTAQAEPVRPQQPPVATAQQPSPQPTPAPPAAPSTPPAAAPTAPAPEAAAPTAWPTMATLGGVDPAGADQPSAPAGPPGEDVPTAGGLDAAALRRSWDAVLDAVKTRKRVTHARLLDAQVLAIRGRTLSLGFSTPTLAKQFKDSVNIDVLKEALAEAIGADLDVDCTVAGAAAAPPTTLSSQATAPSSYDGFAPGDEAAPEDPDAPPPPEAALHGEDAALRLVESELGGKVVGTVGD
jgi:DNA polymerase-3 subunit gamma/tau